MLFPKIINLKKKIVFQRVAQPGHSLSDMKFTILEQVKKVDELYRKQREKYFIQKFDTYNTGMNRKKLEEKIGI